MINIQYQISCIDNSQFWHKVDKTLTNYLMRLLETQLVNKVSD